MTDIPRKEDIEAAKEWHTESVGDIGQLSKEERKHFDTILACLTLAINQTKGNENGKL